MSNFKLPSPNRNIQRKQIVQPSVKQPALDTDILWTQFKDEITDLVAKNILHTTTRSKPDKIWVSYCL